MNRHESIQAFIAPERQAPQTLLYLEIPVRYKTVRQQHLAYCKCNDRSAALSSTLHKLRVTLGETEKYCPFIDDGMLATGLARFGIIASRSAC